MKAFAKYVGLVFAVLWVQVSAQTPERASDRLTIPLSNPDRPAVLKAGLMNGGITVKTYAGKEIIVEAHVRTARYSKDKHKDKDYEREREEENNKERTDRDGKRSGMRRVEINTTGLAVEEDNNVVEVEAGSMSRTIDLTIQVPVRTSLELSCLNDGDIVVEGVTGEIEVNNTNGAVTITNVSGSVVAHALNDDVRVVFAKVQPGKAMSFSSLNGDIDVTFPADVKATISMKSDNGEIYSDFDIKLEPKERRVEENSRSEGGKYRVRLEKAMIGTINGGGPEIQFSTFNGDV
ncbi:MAG: DUF4097 family beta strand repeat-containing protein, partial [candidate division KSB1 bacterium]